MVLPSSFCDLNQPSHFAFSYYFQKIRISSNIKNNVKCVLNIVTYSLNSDHLRSFSNFLLNHQLSASAYLDNQYLAVVTEGILALHPGWSPEKKSTVQFNVRFPSILFSASSLFDPFQSCSHSFHSTE